MSDTPKTQDTMVAALLRERAGYAGRKGMDDRVAAVDEQLQLRGYAPDGEPLTRDEEAPLTEESEEPPAEESGKKPEPRSTPPKGRQTRGTDKT